ncbi:jg8249 [Pararge aegeria aegeria]|uniref:Jg8249 protein n=1 Tax=Pararge aegeria aegeria TaxID=348720 RepID=A0A8S4RPW6_9NEOP|nr:jg8249 [Pararge aegeria aegeria]
MHSHDNELQQKWHQQQQCQYGSTSDVNRLQRSSKSSSFIAYNSSMSSKGLFQSVACIEGMQSPRTAPGKWRVVTTVYRSAVTTRQVSVSYFNLIFKSVASFSIETALSVCIRSDECNCPAHFGDDAALSQGCRVTRYGLPAFLMGNIFCYRIGKNNIYKIHIYKYIGREAQYIKSMSSD